MQNDFIISCLQEAIEDPRFIIQPASPPTKLLPNWNWIQHFNPEWAQNSKTNNETHKKKKILKSIKKPKWVVSHIFCRVSHCKKRWKKEEGIKKEGNRMLICVNFMGLN
jgi:hypothetical protein